MRLPFFPLHAVVFPHLPQPLHVFEDRYRAMAVDLVDPDGPYDGRFVIAMISDGREVGDDPSSRQVGTICEVRQARRFGDGRWAMLGVGLSRAWISDAQHVGRPYLTVEAIPLAEITGAGARDLLEPAQQALDAYLETVKRFVATAASVGGESQEIRSVAASLDEVLKPIHLPDDPLAASYAIGGVLQIELARKQQLLELPDAASRLRAEIDLLRREARLLADGAMPPVAASDLTYNPN
jgi:Lon protease-like protein